MKRLLLAGLATLTLAISRGLPEEDADCFPEERVKQVVEQIPYNFRETGEPHVYLIEYVSESRKGYTEGGRLTVYLPNEGDTTFYGPNDRWVISVFDRTGPNPDEWSYVSNWDSGKVGCVNGDGCHLAGTSRSKSLSGEDSQKRFNKVMERIEDLIEIE